MLDKFDYILKFLAFVSLTIVTMLTFDSVRNLNKLFKSRAFLHYSIFVLWISGVLLIFIDGYISTRDKTAALTVDLFFWIEGHCIFQIPHIYRPLSPQ
jgi:hypothetical protein